MFLNLLGNLIFILLEIHYALSKFLSRISSSNQLLGIFTVQLMDQSRQVIGVYAMKKTVGLLSIIHNKFVQILSRMSNNLI